MIEAIITLSVVLFISLLINIILVLYNRNVLMRAFLASEKLSEVIIYIDSFKEHLKSVYETPTFYGDSTLQSLLDHAREIANFLNQYDDLYSFTQPNLQEQLGAVTLELENEEINEEENPQNQV